MNCEEKENLIKAHLHRGCGCGRQQPCRESRRPLALPPPSPSPDPSPMLVPLPMLDLHLVCPSLVSSWLPCSAAMPIWRGRHSSVKEPFSPGRAAAGSRPSLAPGEEWLLRISPPQNSVIGGRMHSEEEGEEALLTRL